MKTKIAIAFFALLALTANGQTTNRISDLSLATSLTSTDRVNVIQWTGVASATGSMWTNRAATPELFRDYVIADPLPLLVGSTVFVSTNGNDATVVRGDRGHAARTLTRAIEIKQSGDVVFMDPGDYDFTVTVTAGDTTETNRIVSNFALIGSGIGVTRVNVIPRGTNEHNRVLSVPASTPVTNVTFRGFTLDGNASDYAWDTGGKLDWILQGQNITVENVEVTDWGGNAALEAFTPLFQSSTNPVVRNCQFRLPGSANVTGPTIQDSSRALFEGNVVEGYNIAFGMVGMSSWNVITGNRMTNITTAGFIYDTAGSGEIWGNTISRNRFSSAGDGVLVGLGAHLDLRIFGNEFFGSNRGINLTNYTGSGTNYYLRPIVTENTFYISSGRNIYGTGVTNGAFFLNIGRSTSDNSVSGSANFGAFNEDRTGTLYTGIPNTLQGDGSAITALNDDNVSFDDADSNWTATTIGAALEELDDANGGAPNQATGKVNWEQLVNVPAGFADGADDGGAGSGTPTFVNGTEVTQGPDFDNTSASGTVTPTTFSVSDTNVTLTIGNASATAAGAVTTGTQSFAGAKTFTGDVTVEGTLILSGSGGGGMDSLHVTNKFTNGVLTATRVVYVGSDEALTDDAGLTYDGSTDTLTSGAFVAGATNVIGALAGKQATLTDSSGLRGALSDELGTGAALFDGATLALNLASAANTSVSNVINMDLATSTIAVGGNISYQHATNGAAGTVKTHVASFLNWSGGNVTLTIPSGWRTNVYSAVPANLTNGTITRMFVTSLAATGDSANQTNVLVSFEYYK